MTSDRLLRPRHRARSVIVVLAAALLAAACSATPGTHAASVQSLTPVPPPTPSPSPTPTPTLPATPSPTPPASRPAPPAPTPTPKPSPKPTTTPPAPVPPSPIAVITSGLAGRVVVIDPGHNGQNYAHTSEINRLVDIGNGTKACDTTGTAANNGYSEAAYNLDVAQRLASLLTGAGAKVILTRTDNSGWGPCIDERAAVGNRAHADVAISIHADGSSVGRGFHVIYPASLPGLTDAIVAPSLRLAGDVRDAYAAGTGVPYSTYAGHNALEQRSDLGGLNLSKVPKVFIETGNMRDGSDAALLEDPGFRQRAAQALEAGLQAFLSGR